MEETKTSHCILDTWKGHDFTPCFRETILNGLLLFVILLGSVFVLWAAIVRHRRSKQSDTLPLGTKAIRTYGATHTTSSARLSLAHTPKRSSPLDPSKLNIVPWSIYNTARCVVSLLQLCLYAYLLIQLNSDDFIIDKRVQGNPAQVILASGVHFIYYAYAFALSVMVVFMSDVESILFANTLCQHIAWLYVWAGGIEVINVRSYYIIYDVDMISTGYGLCLLSLFLNIVLLLILINEERDAPKEAIYADNGRIISNEKWASLYSKYMFSWVNDMMKEGYKKPLNDKMLMEVIDENRAKNVLKEYRAQTATSMIWALLKVFQKPLISQFWYCMVWSVAMFGPSYFLNKIIQHIEHKDSESSSVTTAFLNVFGLFLATFINSLVYQRALYIGRSLGTRIQSIVVGEVYSSTLRRRDESGASAQGEKPKGNLNNFMSVDAQKMGELTAYLFFAYCFPIQLCICIWSLYKLLGIASIYGMVVMAILQPCTYLLSRKYQKLHQDVMGCTDKRIKIMNELLGAIRIVKFFAWEDQFRHRVTEARQVELKAIRSRLYLYMWMENTWFLIPVIIMVTVFYVYTRTYVLTASVAFTALALFNTLKTVLDQLPMITSFGLQAKVSYTRISKFLQEEHLSSLLPTEAATTTKATTSTATSTSTATKADFIGFVDQAAFSWNKELLIHENPTLSDLDLSFPLGKLSLICGPIGSGKTTLLASLLGETYCHAGKAFLPRKPMVESAVPVGGAASGIAYVAQTAWLQNCSIRDNILFGLPMDQKRYEAVLYMTALTRDLAILEGGDSTEIGEKGITLSGGQKQRVAIARAVYSQAEIVIFDDCLSAVDAHTAKHLYEHCLTGPLMTDRTALLVTHHVSLCIKKASYVVVLENGKVLEAGEPSLLIQSGVLGDEFTQTKETENGGPIPVVPKTSGEACVDGTGKLTQEEKKAEGSVDTSVYLTYFYASGGFLFWLSVLVLFCFAKASNIGQDYWIKIWSSSYDVHNTSTRLVYAVKNLLNNSTMLTDKENPEQYVNLSYYLGIYFAIGILSIILFTISQLVLFFGSLVASKRLHSRLLESILRAKVRFFDTTPMGRIVNRFSSDMETVDQSIAPTISRLLQAIISTLYIILLISAITPSFIIPAIFIALIYRFIGDYYLCTSRDLKRINSVSRSPIFVQLNETVNGLATIRAFGSEKRFIHENLERIDNNNRPFLWMWATNRWLHCRVDLMGSFVAFCAGSVLILSSAWVDPGLAGLSLSYALSFNHSVLWIVRMYAIGEMNMNAIERTHEYLILEPEEDQASNIPPPRPQWPETGALKVKNLVVRYAPDTPAVLHGISFSTLPREKIGIVGRTGSGKSTLTLSLFRFMEFSEGQIEIDGVDIQSIGLEHLRSRFTIIPQDPVLFSGTLRSNLDPFGEHTDIELWTALKRAHLLDSANHKLQAVTLDAIVSENGSNWSQGQRQLIALARALIKRSNLIILDEATSSVDFDTDAKIQETIRTEFNNTSMLCIAHRIRTVADYDRILVLDQGKVVEFDTPYQLMTSENGIFRQMCERSGEMNELLAIALKKHTSLQ